MMKFKYGDRVKMIYFNSYAHGEVTVPGEEKSKVLFDGNYDLNYDYYPNDLLELESKNEDKK